MVKDFHEMIVFILHINNIINNIVLKASKGKSSGGRVSKPTRNLHTECILIAGKWKNKQIVMSQIVSQLVRSIHTLTNNTARSQNYVPRKLVSYLLTMVISS